ncbi:hypothetical protein BT93_L0475 [Corymbia citriodora subsp. variegata]|uniref:Uncharacterized protein n=1 Tax=Corymbia citriodora subsp. variegata TaxID=360336 RepID=A0A8T0CI78_CORYI|nr:hypothetical protein BT93_L0475 [Corymbia citriodora subsp. variegata]
MGNITRDFRVPTMTQDTAVTIAIHEPVLTEDNLGLKTWASSYVLAKKWAGLASHISSSSSCNDPLPWILELGAGTGLVGIAAATVLATKILLTDLPEIVPNLERNIEANSTVVASRNGSAQAAVLDWSDPATIVPSSKTGAAQPDDNIPEQFMIIVAADPIYSKEQPVLLAQTIAYRLARSPSARAVIEWPIREAYAQERNDFKSEMAARDLELFREESDVGFDDWSTGREEEPSEVECWMGMWRWKVMPVPPA